MYGKPYHKMPLSSWMIPGGNRDEKRKLIMAKKYPMKSAIQKNLGGPLSEVFFSSLTPSQQDQVGYTPKLKGPGKDLWVSPSDILIGKVVLTPPYTNRLRQALTHQGIMALGSEVEVKAHKKHELDLALLLKEKEREMKQQVEHLIQEAVAADREAQQLINNQILEIASRDLSNSYQEILSDSVAQVLMEGSRKLEEVVEKTKEDMEKELCKAVNDRSEYLGKQYEFQLLLRESELQENFENKLKKHRQKCSVAMEKAQKEFVTNLKRIVVHLEAEHITDLLMQASERSQKHHEEKSQLEYNFGAWFVKHFDSEIVGRDIKVLELENAVRKLEDKCARRENQLKEVFKHFQRFINFALKEKPGQAEFMLSIEKELIENGHKEEEDDEGEMIAKVIIEYIIKLIDDISRGKSIENEKEEFNGYTTDNFRGKIQQEKENIKMLHLVGEENLATLREGRFRMNEMISLASLLGKCPSMLPIIENTKGLNKISKMSQHRLQSQNQPF